MKITITVPAAAFAAIGVEHALEGLSLAAHGCTMYDAYGVWSRNGTSVHEQVTVFKFLIPPAGASAQVDTYACMRRINDVVRAMHDAGEDTVLVELDNHGHSFKLLQKGEVYYNA